MKTGVATRRGSEVWRGRGVSCSSQQGGERWIELKEEKKMDKGNPVKKHQLHTWILAYYYDSSSGTYGEDCASDRDNNNSNNFYQYRWLAEYKSITSLAIAIAMMRKTTLLIILLLLFLKVMKMENIIECCSIIFHISAPNDNIYLLHWCTLL